MHDGPVRVCRSAAGLALQLLELPIPALTPAAVDVMDREQVDTLLAARLLKPTAPEMVTTVDFGDGDIPVPLIRSADHDGCGYFDPRSGWVQIATEDLRRLSFDVPAFVRRLLAGMDVSSREGPIALVDDVIWEVGDVRFGRSRLSVWFARRLGDAVTWKRLKEKARLRPSAKLRIVLTSTPSARLPDDPPDNHLLIAIQDVVQHDSGIEVDPEILTNRIGGVTVPDVESRLHLSPDGRRLVIDGGESLTFKSPVHIKIIRLLVEGYRTGQRYRAEELLQKSGSSAMTLRQAFGVARWVKLECFLKSENGLWGFVI